MATSNIDPARLEELAADVCNDGRHSLAAILFDWAGDEWAAKGFCLKAAAAYGQAHQEHLMAVRWGA